VFTVQVHSGYGFIVSYIEAQGRILGYSLLNCHTKFESFFRDFVPELLIANSHAKGHPCRSETITECCLLRGYSLIDLPSGTILSIYSFYEIRQSVVIWVLLASILRRLAPAFWWKCSSDGGDGPRTCPCPWGGADGGSRHAGVRAWHTIVV
jgi:hypothetical protein